MEVDVSDNKNDNSENNDDRKEAECLYDTFLDLMEEEVSDINDNKNEIYTRKKRLNAYMTLSLMIWKNVYMIETITKMKNMMRKKLKMKKTDSESTIMDEGKGVIHERGGKDVDLD